MPYAWGWSLQLSTYTKQPSKSSSIVSSTHGRVTHLVGFVAQLRTQHQQQWGWACLLAACPGCSPELLCRWAGPTRTAGGSCCACYPRQKALLPVLRPVLLAQPLQLGVSWY